MYRVSEDFKEKILSDNREFSVALTFNSTTELTGTTIQSISVDEIVNSTDSLTLGCACPTKITIELINPPRDIDYENSFFTATVGLKMGEMPTVYEYVPLGKFYVTSAETKNDFKNLTITAYDGFCKMVDKYEPKTTKPVKLQDIYNDLKAQLSEKYGIAMKTVTLPTYTVSNPHIADITIQQAIGYLAGCVGGFARFGRDGVLEIVSYTETGIMVDRNTQYMNGFKRLTDKPLVVTSIKTGTQKNAIVRGDGANGTEIVFENPYITSAMADSVYSKFNDLTYTPSQLKWRGNPAIQAGDIVQALDNDGNAHTVLVMSHNIRVGGGLNCTIECKGKSIGTSNFSTNYQTTNQKIDKIYQTLEQAIIDATNAITGNKGGYVIIRDTNDDTKPDEILVMDQEDPDVARNVWRWNKEGFGHSNNGINGPFTTAITANGQIVANFITAGTLSAERIAVENFDANDPTRITDYIRFGDGTMTFGKGDSAITLKLENDQVAFYNGNRRIAYFSNNSFEIENLTDGQIRFQNFGFIPRESGNLTFTKLK